MRNGLGARDLKVLPGGAGSVFEGPTLNAAGGSNQIGPRVYADRVALRDNGITNYHSGICVMLGRFYSNPAPPGVVIERNRVHDWGERPATNHHDGIYLSEARNTIGRDNRIHDNADRSFGASSDLVADPRRVASSAGGYRLTEDSAWLAKDTGTMSQSDGQAPDLPPQVNIGRGRRAVEPRHRIRLRGHVDELAGNGLSVAIVQRRRHDRWHRAGAMAVGADGAFPRLAKAHASGVRVPAGRAKFPGLGHSRVARARVRGGARPKPDWTSVQKCPGC